jgi:hypothetical protein
MLNYNVSSLITIILKYQIMSPNIMVKWLTLLLCIQEVSGSNLGAGD